MFPIKLDTGAFTGQLCNTLDNRYIMYMDKVTPILVWLTFASEFFSIKKGGGGGKKKTEMYVE